jgi:hypothetical protein
MNRPAGQKCGNCAFFEVRNPSEADLARVAKDEAECAPGEWVFEGKRNVGCHGGPVQGLCRKWKERGAPGPAIFSTQWCPLWKGGGPVLRQAGSMNAPAKGEPAPAAQPAPPARPEGEGLMVKLDRNGALVATAIVAGLAAFGLWRRGV